MPWSQVKRAVAVSVAIVVVFSCLTPVPTEAASFTCPGASATSRVTLPAVDAPTRVSGKPYHIAYGSLPLSFATVTKSPGALCTVRSNRGALPVKLEIPEPHAAMHVADSVTTATVDFLHADAPSTHVPRCDFSGLLASDAPDDCLLTTSDHDPGAVIARWSIPGFAEYVPGQRGVPVYTTRPLTYYADLGALGGAHPASFTRQLQRFETFVHRTLIENLPSIDPIGVIQDPPAHLHITDPRGRTVGLDTSGEVRTFPGAGYEEIGDRSIAWILAPPAGRYRVTAHGPAGSPFVTEFTVLPGLGRGAVPTIQDTLWRDVLGRAGTNTRTFSVPID